MHYEDLWQLYSNNGTPIAGKGATKEEFKANPDFIMGNSHIWFWKSKGTTVEIMLQKRSLAVADKPGWYHISAGGHINVGETPVEAAVREAKEEVGLDIDPAKLHYVHSVRIIPRAPNDIVNVFLYRLNGDEAITHDDGEAGSYEWRTLDEWKEITKNAENHKLIDQGELYFNTLTKALEQTFR